MADAWQEDEINSGLLQQGTCQSSGRSSANNSDLVAVVGHFFAPVGSEALRYLTADKPDAEVLL
ncbi:hypothetical protein FHS85_003118 [Rhodoligotrophos appendicifer]|uniref:hypothetical protein n=1 Tax=Rhodoligotrophos appendicifer TaxID=987056 RepID=UPI001FEA60B7|nr:hypothetical protein [Rhodoligotrophos appendicifer]